MAILNIGSINIDHVYRVAAHPAAGETVLDKGYSRGLGGKGANMSLAAAAGGAEVRHAGAVGEDGQWCCDQMAARGVNVAGVAVLPDVSTGHGLISVDDAGENVIIVHSGANMALTKEMIVGAIGGAAPGDWLLLQNETNLVPQAARIARDAGLKIAYAAAPFDPGAAAAMANLADLIVVNQIEAEQLSQHLGRSITDLGLEGVLVTLGAEGAVLYNRGAGTRTPAFPVEPVDTTGAGDTFLGFFLAGRDLQMEPPEALRRAAAAAAIQVTRPGAGDAIPDLAEVETLLSA